MGFTAFRDINRGEMAGILMLSISQAPIAQLISGSLGFLFGLFFTIALDISHWVSRAGDKFFAITWDEWKTIFTRLKSLFTRHKKK